MRCCMGIEVSYEGEVCSIRLSCFAVTYSIFSFTSQRFFLSLKPAGVFSLSQSTAAGGEGESLLSPMGGNKSKDRDTDREAGGQHYQSANKHILYHT